MGVLLVFLVGLWVPVRVPAQDEPAKGEVASARAEPTATATVPLGKFVPKENLILYVEFAGLNSTAAAWKNTAAYRMLNETPLGVMMEQVTTQLLEKTLSLYPNHKLNASELFSLIKHSVQSGWVLAIHANPKSSDGPLRGTLVVRSAAGKEFRALSARTMGWMMGDAKPKPEWKAGRMMVAVPALAPTAPAAGPNAGWVWWAEKDDLAISFPGPAGGDAVIAALDGKTPSALEHPLYQGLSKPEGGFQPVCFAFADTANCPAIPTRLTELLHTMGAEWGVQRIDARLGFEGDALVTVTRLVAPKPRRGPLALLDHQPTFETSAILPLPNGVDSFVALSMHPAQVLEALYAADTSDTIKTQVEELAKSIRRAGKIDIEKDLLAHLGPKMVLFLAPERSAATNDESAESALKKGFSLLALTTAMQSVLPKLTLVAHVDNPESFGKALEAVVVAANMALKSRAHEMAEEERATAALEPEGGARAGGPGGARAGTTGARSRRRRPEDTPAPQFTPVLGQENAFVLTTPRESALKLGPGHFRPTIQLEGKYLVISTSSDAVRTALAALQRKDAKPSDEVRKVCATVPNRLIALGVNDVRDGLSSVLASWPGTLQATVNTAIALSRPRTEPEKATTGGGGGGQQQAGRGASMAGMRPRGIGAAGGLSRAAPGGAGGPAADGERGSSAGANPSGNGSGASGSGADMIQLNVDADKLPKADDLKKLLSASIAFINLSDEEVRFTTRTAFPNFGLPIQVAPLLASTPLGQRIREALVPAQANPDQASPSSGSASPGATGAPPGGQSGSPPAAPSGKRRGRRGGDD